MLNKNNFIFGVKLYFYQDYYTISWVASNWVIAAFIIGAEFENAELSTQDRFDYFLFKGVKYHKFTKELVNKIFKQDTFEGVFYGKTSVIECCSMYVRYVDIPNSKNLEKEILRQQNIIF
jgi:hypothetical protein